jgi:wobble nucleotide-excising tRNase
MLQPQIFANISKLVAHIRGLDKKYVLIYAHNGTGKTRLSMEFRHDGKKFDKDRNVIERDTLYFNAFTEDLFYWDNDLDSDTQRVLKLNTNSQFFSGLKELEMDNKIRPLLHRYFDFNFLIDYDNGTVNFIREEIIDEIAQNIENIKVSRGEENIFIWCFFLAIAQLAIDKQQRYDWVQYIYVDDSVSSLDDNNTIAIAHHLAQILKTEGNKIKTIISTHHGLFFNVLCNELKSSQKYFFKQKWEQLCDQRYKRLAVFLSRCINPKYSASHYKRSTFYIPFQCAAHHFRESR